MPAIERCLYYLKALGHAIRADSLLNLKTDAITPHSPTGIHEHAQTDNAHVRPAITYCLELPQFAVSGNFLMPVASHTQTL